jgi:hypothetical protein
MKPSFGQSVAAYIRSIIRYSFIAAGIGAPVYAGTLVYLVKVANVPNPTPSEVYRAGLWVWLALLGMYVAFKYGERYGRFGAELDRQEKEARAATAE